MLYTSRVAERAGEAVTEDWEVGMILICIHSIGNGNGNRAWALSDLIESIGYRWEIWPHFGICPIPSLYGSWHGHMQGTPFYRFQCRKEPWSTLLSAIQPLRLLVYEAPPGRVLVDWSRARNCARSCQHECKMIFSAYSGTINSSAPGLSKPP